MSRNRSVTGFIREVLLLALLEAVFSVEAVKNCTRAEAENCSHDIRDPGFYGNAGLGSLEVACRLDYARTLDCYAEVFASCGSTPEEHSVVITIGTFYTGADHLCSQDFLSEYRSYASCIETQDFYDLWHSCMDKFEYGILGSGSDPDVLCRLLLDFRMCYLIPFSCGCGKQAADSADRAFYYILGSGFASILPNCNINAPLEEFGYPNPCRNEGQCRTSAGKIACLCQPGFEGQQCETPIYNNDSCSTVKCLNGGTCIAETQGGSTCLCAEGYTGTTCNSLLSTAEDSQDISTAIMISVIVGVLVIVGMLVGLAIIVIYFYQKNYQPKELTTGETAENHNPHVKSLSAQDSDPPVINLQTAKPQSGTDVDQQLNSSTGVYSEILTDQIEAIPQHSEYLKVYAPPVVSTVTSCDLGQYLTTPDLETAHPAISTNQQAQYQNVAHDDVAQY